MNIQRIVATNFKSFEALEVNFTDLKGIYRIQGPVGAGKTSIGEAILFALYGSVQNKNNKDLIRWGSNKMELSIWLKSRGENIYINRIYKSYGQPQVYVEVNGTPLEATNVRDLQSQLEARFDTSRQAIELLSIISFNGFMSLSQMDTKNTRAFINHVLSLGDIYGYVDVCKTLSGELYSQVQVEEGKMSVLEDQSNYLHSLMNRPILESGRPIETIQHDIDMVKAMELDETIYRNLLKDLHDHEREYEQIHSLWEHRLCPTCGFEVDNDEWMDIKLLQLQDSIQSIKERIQQEEASIRDHKRTKQARLDTLYDELKQETIIEESNKEKSNIEGDVYGRLKEMGDELENLNESLAGKQGEINQLKSLQKCLLDTVIPAILNGFIPHLNKRIREIGSILRLEFIPQYDSSFNCTINGDIPVKSLSTGQGKLVDICIILAILGSLLNKSHYNVLFLDELFSNLDGDSRGRVLEALRSCGPETVLIVSHQDLDVDGSILVQSGKLKI